ncbi:MAG: SMP-30/gluconolactonase/LRE family protein, partial [Verrucomicrobia bacterium]|nr:SMP-30/gluconolactonase/LRE family protein [Verrucomicrobiota bacterium]
NGRKFSRALTSAATFASVALVTGCSPASSDARDSFQSRLFSRVEIIGSRGTGAGQFNKPRSVALDRDDNLYVADMTGRVQKFSPDGKFLLLWQMEETDKGKPKGMCRDELGNIVVVEPHYSRVNHFAPDGKLVKQWGANGTNAGDLYFPRAVAVGADGATWVSEYGHTERVQKFSGQGAAFMLGVGKPGGAAGEFNRAEGIGLAPDGTLFVADSCNHRVQVFSAEGKFLREIGKAGSSVGELSYPYDVRVDVSGLIYVCEFGNSRVQVFDPAGNTVEILGEAGAMPGEFANPWSIALDSKGNLFVADSQNHRVQKFITKLTRKSVVSGQWSVDERERALANATDHGQRTTDPARP